MQIRIEPGDALLIHVSYAKCCFLLPKAPPNWAINRYFKRASLSEASPTFEAEVSSGIGEA